jgi:Ca-activated chloride channel family protein
VLALAGKAKGEDPEGYRAEFIQLVKKAMIIKE